MNRYNPIQIGNTSRYVVVDSESGFRIVYKNAPMAPVDEKLAKVIADGLNELANPAIEPEPSKTFACVVCHGINHLKHIRCAICGTIPERLSMIRQPCREVLEANPVECFFGHFIAVNAANGCERQRSRRTIKKRIRTVPMDYYADLTS